MKYRIVDTHDTINDTYYFALERKSWFDRLLRLPWQYVCLEVYLPQYEGNREKAFEKIKTKLDKLKSVSPIKKEVVYEA